jgi:dTDP-4-dehydrorhamnose reductase
MRVLVTGANGQLGKELLRVLPEQGHTVIGKDRTKLDIADSFSVEVAIDEARPDVLINCAAWTKVDAAESEPDAAHRVNALGAELVAKSCAAHDILLCHISTDYVFDGKATTPIPESAPASPLSVYGKTKLAGENAIRSHAKRHQIVRTSWLYGQQGPNFVLTMLRLGKEKPSLRVVNDQQGAPTWTGNLAPALAKLIELDFNGTLHITNSGQTTWCQFARAIFEAVDISTPVEAITTEEYPLPAPRPRYAVLSNRAWHELGQPLLPDWRDGLKSYMKSLEPAGVQAV